MSKIVYCLELKVKNKKFHVSDSNAHTVFDNPHQPKLSPLQYSLTSAESLPKTHSFHVVFYNLIDSVNTKPDNVDNVV